MSFSFFSPVSFRRLFAQGLLLLLVWILVWILVPGQIFAREDTLHQLRAQRRLSQLEVQSSSDKSDGPALFGLLVIPVDFSDERLGADWDPVQVLGPRLFPDQDHSLYHYFKVASGEKLDLRITLAPVVHLSGTRREYSDVGYNGFTRTRALATQSLQAVKEGGLEFRSLDMEGPDRIPGSVDDDGQIDGVLILHAGIGQENDTDNGLVQALQFFLEDPVVSGGISASFYAVASLHSGPGIWAHETGHLLGMEDRYDPLLHPVSGGSDVRSLGGLGRFSLMASGAWGTGYGWQPALPDAYTCAQLGWYPWRYLPDPSGVQEQLEPGIANRIWTNGEIGSEFFLTEVRDPESHFPYDANIPGAQMLVYHVDESVPEGSWNNDGQGDYHLRVRLVEADDDGELAAGQDDGRPEDLFPGPLGVQNLTPFTQPSTHGYSETSQVYLTDITSDGSQVTYAAAAATDPSVAFEFSWSGYPSALLDLKVRSTGTPLNSLQCIVRDISNPSWGTFPSAEDSVNIALFESEPGLWQPGQDVTYLLETEIEPGMTSHFQFTFSGPGFQSEKTRTWLWQASEGPLDFQNNWPGDWTITQHGSADNTTWHRWAGPPYLVGGNGPVLAATGTAFDSSTHWPDVHYNNNAWIRLHSGAIDPETTFVRIIHTLESEVLVEAVAMDGGRLLWESESSEPLAADILDGYPRNIHPGTNNPLTGSPVFADSLLHLNDGVPTWNIDVVPVPSSPGPWKLNLEFASNSVWRYAGWFVAQLVELSEFSETSAFPVQWDPVQGLSWDWPHEDLNLNGFKIEASEQTGAPWFEIRSGLGGGPVPADHLLALLPGEPSSRFLVRVVARTDLGHIASRPVVVYPDGGFQTGVKLGLPRPNPSRDQVQFRLEIPEGQEGRLQVYDVRGRLVGSWLYAAGNYLAHWDGRTASGHRVASGIYFIRLEGSGPVQTRKVVLIN